MSDQETVFHPKGPCSSICSIDPSKCHYYQRVDPSLRRSFSDILPDSDGKDDEKYEDEMDIEEPYQKGDIDDSLYSPIIPYMDTDPIIKVSPHISYKVKECKDLFKFPPPPPPPLTPRQIQEQQFLSSILSRSSTTSRPAPPNPPQSNYLFPCKSIGQYCINFGKRTRLVTIIGETHISQNLIEEYKTHLKRHSVNRPNSLTFFIDYYIREINKKCTEVGKRLAIFLEMPPSEDYSYGSLNIWLIKNMAHFISNGVGIDHSKEPFLNLGNLDIRYISYEGFFPEESSVDFFSQQRKNVHKSNIDLCANLLSYIFYENPDISIDKISMGDIKKLSLYLSKILKYCCRLFKEDGRFKINTIYTIEHIAILNSIYDSIKLKSNDIKTMIDSISSYDNSTILNNISQSDIPIAKKIISDFKVFSEITDLYSIIHFFKKDYPYDDIIFVVGAKHAENINKILENYRVMYLANSQQNPPQNDVINLNNTFF